MTAALEGLRVIEVGPGKAVAYAGKLLRDLGAEVIKVEPPSATRCGARGRSRATSRIPSRSGLFIYFNGGTIACASDDEWRALARVAARAARVDAAEGI